MSKPAAEDYGLSPELLREAEGASSYYSGLADWSEILEQAIADFDRGLLTRDELIAVADGRMDLP